MALLDENQTFKRLNFEEAIDEDDDESPWDDLLNEAKQNSTKLQEHKNVVILGDLSSGKTTLIAKLQGNEEPEKGSGLEFTHLTVSDEYREDSTKLGMWVLDGDPTHSGLLKYALTEENYQDTVVVVAASMSQPWSIMKTLNDWLTILSDHLDRICINQEKRHECEQKLVKHFQEYVEPDSGHSARLTTSTGTDTSEAPLLPLGESVLTHNLGIPIIVVITKSDAVSSLEKEHDYREEKFDFIQHNIRKLCLNYGAALVYLSVREEKNCDLLYKYLAHRIYGLEFTSQAAVVDRDSIFVPSGWDSDKKIDILTENLSMLKADEPYENVIKRPMQIRRPANRDTETSAEQEQDFLTRCHNMLSKGAPAMPAAAAQSASSSPLMKAPSKTRLSTPPTSSNPSPKKPMEATKAGGGQQSETVLANFFNSLLTKKSGSPAKASPDAKNAARAELDRMNRNSTSKPS